MDLIILLFCVAAGDLVLILCCCVHYESFWVVAYFVCGGLLVASWLLDVILLLCYLCLLIWAEYLRLLGVGLNVI